MKKLPLLLLPALLTLAGCADSARVHAVSPAITASWPSVQEDANLGIQARSNAAAAAALNVPLISAGVAASRAERVRQFDAAVAALVGANP